MKPSLRYILLLLIILFSCSSPETPEELQDNDDEPAAEAPAPDEQETPVGDSESKLEINSISPLMADLGDTLSLRGKNFTSGVRLSIGQRAVELYFNNDSLVEFIIPYQGFDPFDIKLTVDNRDSIAIVTEAFELFPPVVDSIPGNFGFRDTVVVYGKHLTNHPDVRDGIIEIDNDRITVLDQNKDSIRFILPYSHHKHKSDIRIRAQLQEVWKEGGIVVPDPIIYGVSRDSVLIGQTITLYGANFFPYRTGHHQLTLDEKTVEILEAFSDSLIVKIPLGPFDHREIGNFRLKVLDAEVTFSTDLYLKNIWYLYDFIRKQEISRMAGANPISRQSFYYDGAFYFNVHDYKDGFQNISNSNFRLYRYSPDNKALEKQPDIPVPDDTNFAVMELFPIAEGEIYVYVKRDTDNFYKYNFLTGNMVELSDFIGESPLGDAIGFIQNGNFYMGGGSARAGSSSYRRNNRFWKYSEAMDSWSEISSIPEVPGQYEFAYYSNHFEWDNKTYICNGARAYETWEFTPDETWVRKADLVNPVSQTVFTQIGDKGFFYHYGEGNFWEYDITGDEWRRREDLSIEGYQFGRETLLVHGEYVYMVGYQSGYPPDGSGFFNLDQVILRTELSNFVN